MSVSISDSGIVFNDGSLQPTALTTGTQTIAGAKTFSSAVAAPSFTVSGVDISGVGANQTWQDVKASRASGTTYTNSTGRSIVVTANWTPGGNLSGYGTVTVVVAGVTIFYRSNYHNTDTTTDFAPPFVVPPGATYSITVAGQIGTLNAWAELR